MTNAICDHTPQIVTRFITKPLYCRYKILNFQPPKTVTSFIDDPKCNYFEVVCNPFRLKEYHKLYVYILIGKLQSK